MSVSFPVLYPTLFVQIETGSGDKQTNISLVSREDFERLKNFSDSPTNCAVSPEVCPDFNLSF